MILARIHDDDQDSQRLKLQASVKSFKRVGKGPAERERVPMDLGPVGRKAERKKKNVTPSRRGSAVLENERNVL